MNERRKSNLKSWIWFIAAIVVALTCLAFQPLAFFTLGINHDRFWSFAFLAAVIGAFCSMMRVAQSYDEDDSPNEPPAPLTADEKREGRLFTAIWVAGFLLAFGPSLWDDFANSPVSRQTERALWWSGMALLLVGGLLRDRIERHRSVKRPPQSLIDERNARLSTKLWTAGFFLMLGPRLWNDFAGSRLPAGIEIACLCGAMTLLCVATFVPQQENVDCSSVPPSPRQT